MENTVSVLSLFIMLISLVLGFAIPIMLLIRLRKKYKCGIDTFFVGCGVMILFAFVLERMVHSIVLGSSAGNYIQGNIWMYGIYGGLMAGLFEETGRYIAFRFVLKRQQKNDYNALMYGVGHGGIEMIMLMVPVMLNNLIYSLMINTGTMSQAIEGLTGAQADAMNSVVIQLTSASPMLFLLNPLERIAAVILQLSFSVLVWFAAKQKKMFILFPITILLHMLVDAIAVIASQNGMSLILVEAIIYILTGICAYIAVRVWKTHKSVPDLRDEME